MPYFFIVNYTKLLTFTKENIIIIYDIELKEIYNAKAY